MYTLPGLELGRFRRTTMARLAMLVIAVIPALYGCLYLASNWEPTNHLDRLDAAVVNADIRADLPDKPDGSKGGTLSAGDDLTEELTTSDDAGFHWHEVDEKTAQRGLESGRYVAVLRIPTTFSSDIASSGKDDPRRARLTIDTDDAHNYIVGTIAKQVLESIRTNLNETVTGDYVDQVYVGFNEIQAKMEEASDGADQIADGSSDLKDGTTQLAEGTGTAKDGSGQLATGLDKLSNGTGELSNGADQLADGASTLHSGTGDLVAGTGEIADKSGDLADGAQKVADGTGQLATKADQIDARAAAVRERVDEFDDAATPVISQHRKDLSGARDTASTDLRTKVDDLAERYPDDPDVQALAKDMDSYVDTLDRYGDEAKARADRVETARRNVRQTVDGAADKIDDAASAIHQLNDGASQVADGADRLHGGLVQLDQGANRLNDGAAQLDSGASKLSEGAGQLAEGADTAATAGHQLADGLVKLDDGATRLDEGAGKLKSGTRELADGIASGAEQVPTYSDADRATRSDVVAVPVDGHAQRDHEVTTYGEGLAPFFLSLALWIGGMITYMVINAVPYRALASSARSWRIAWSGYAPGVFFGVAQVLVIFLVLTLTLDFTVPSWLATVAFALLIAASFHAIHQLCIAALGTIGRLVALVLLMLQIGAAGGTYPVETTPAFFQAISPFLPMTYAVSGLRGLIAGGNAVGVLHASVMLVLFGAVALAATAYVSSRKRVMTLSRLYPSLEI